MSTKTAQQIMAEVADFIEGKTRQPDTTRYRRQLVQELRAAEAYQPLPFAERKPGEELKDDDLKPYLERMIGLALVESRQGGATRGQALKLLIACFVTGFKTMMAEMACPACTAESMVNEVAERLRSFVPEHAAAAIVRSLMEQGASEADVIKSMGVGMAVDDEDDAPFRSHHKPGHA